MRDISQLMIERHVSKVLVAKIKEARWCITLIFISAFPA
jgi:hypothetical protein